MKLSIVIPVYRTEATLDRCVTSVLQQRVADMEVILVDDASPDRCPQLCDEWAARDGRVRVVHLTENSGLSAARNAGIDRATGDIITFVDSDDYLSADVYAPLLPTASSCDILEFSVADRLQLSDHCYEDVGDYWLECQAFSHMYAWNKLYRRSLFDDVRFPEGKIFEDVYTLPLLLRKCRRIVTSSHGHYYYTLNPQGITATADGRALAMLLDAHLSAEMPMDDHYYMYLVNIQMDVCERTGAAPLLPPRKVRTAGLDIKKKLKATILNTLGLKPLCKIIQLVHHIRKPSRW